MTFLQESYYLYVNFIETLEGVEAVMRTDYLLSDSIEHDGWVHLQQAIFRCIH